MKHWIKCLFSFCRHDWIFMRNIYGDEINKCEGHRSMWCCRKCGVLKTKPNLMD